MANQFRKNLLLYGTLRLQCFHENMENKSKIGTGFYHRVRAYNKSDDKDCLIDVIITNRHNVYDEDNNEGYKHIRLKMHVEDSDGLPDTDNYKILRHDDLQSAVVYHPDPSIDLAAIVVTPFFNPLEGAGLTPYFISNTFNSMGQNLNNHATRDVLMVGYPIGIWDKANNMPIMRKGSLATHLQKDYEGRPEFMVDSGVYPGSSGSPVYYYTDGVDNETGEMTEYTKLIGIVFRYMVYTLEGVLTTDKKEEVGIPSGLGKCLKAHLINDFEQPLVSALGAMVKPALIEK